MCPIILKLINKYSVPGPDSGAAAEAFGVALEGFEREALAETKWPGRAQVTYPTPILGGKSDPYTFFVQAKLVSCRGTSLRRICPPP